MTTRRPLRNALVAVALAVASVSAAPAAPAADAPRPDGDPRPGRRGAPHDVVTWAAGAERLGEGVAGRAYRLVVRVSVGGTDLRVRLTNAEGDRPVTFDSVRAGIRAEGAALVPGSNRRVTFGGAGTVTLPAGATVFSDPLPGRVPGGRDLAVSLHSPDAAGPVTGHGTALQTSYVTDGDRTAEESAAHWPTTVRSWSYLDAVTVRAPAPTGAVVTLGDSITDGHASTADRNRRWPDRLAARLRASSATTVEGVANEGISGNRVLTDGSAPSALHRLDRDALSLPGVRTVLLVEGVNDLKAAPGATADALLAGYRAVVARAHAAGVCVVGATVAPFKGWPEWDRAAEAVRQEVNAVVREGGVFDAVTDADRVLRSPHDPERLSPFLDGGDHLHPDDDGMRALADAVDLTALECAGGPPDDAGRRPPLSRPPSAPW
ncbi:SGNH/GDSL hydrolase family protein [Streptomyces sp. NPDC091281]|uniref:SGNH/GDSL hydrolase family protein n=1 Tax=Streptomyces sp. NPDC091281 TaxID=3365985 RepID=UPI0038004821